jgi:DNA-binding response OmpR family regulator
VSWEHVDPALGRRVLIIDDSELCRAVEAEVLGKAGFDVRAAANLFEFDRLLASWSPELILTDLQMPDIDGATLCRLLRAKVETARIPIVLCSSLGEDRLAVIAREVGADAFLSKADGYEQLPLRLRALWDEIVW